MRKLLIVAVLLLAGLVLRPLPGGAHHGWSWTTGGNIELTGIIQ